MHQALKRLSSLVGEQATRERVEEVLGKSYIWYERNTTSWTSFESAGTAVPERVRIASNKYSKLMAYTTMWQQTWIFLNDDDVMQDYIISSQ